MAVTYSTSVIDCDSASYPVAQHLSVPHMYFRLGWNADRYMDDTLTREKILDDCESFKNLYINTKKF